MSSASPAPSHPAGLAATLAVVRLVIALVERLFADIADLPPNHPDRRLHARLVAHLARAEAQILADIAVAAHGATLPRRAPHARTLWRHRAALSFP